LPTQPNLEKKTEKRVGVDVGTQHPYQPGREKGSTAKRPHTSEKKQPEPSRGEKTGVRRDKGGKDERCEHRTRGPRRKHQKSVDGAARTT